MTLRNFVAVLAATVSIGALGVAPATAAPASLRVSPGPDCANNGNTNPCWEYQTWFWTFDNCNNYFNEHGYDPNRYDNHICAVFTNGATVGLWLHKYNG